MRLPIRHETYAAVFNTVYVALMANMLLVVGCLPLVAALAVTDPTVTDPARSWPLLALAAPVCAPGLCGVFAVLSAFTADHAAPVLRTFARAWRGCARRATTLAALGVAATVVLSVDIHAAWGHRAGALAIPILAMLIVLVVATSLLGLVALAERPAAPLRDVLRACSYLAVRRWYLSAASLVVLVLLAQVVVVRPALGLGLAAAPLLYVIWANSRYALRPALDPADT